MDPVVSYQRYYADNASEASSDEGVTLGSITAFHTAALLRCQPDFLNEEFTQPRDLELVRMQDAFHLLP